MLSIANMDSRLLLLTITPVLLALHRSFFAQAITDSSMNPFESPYGYSFVTAYESACVVLRTTTDHYIKHPELFSRIWMVWSFNFTSAVSRIFSPLRLSHILS